jgi:glycerol-3-phosphate acyltransferase PlsY
VLHTLPLPLIIAACCVSSYLIGALPFGLWVGLLWKGVDIRTLGSKNIGATNVLRVLGPGPGLMVFGLDTLKGAVGITLAGYLSAQQVIPTLSFSALMLVGFCAILGHTFSPLLRFKGGKGVATSLGVLIALSPVVAGIGLGCWILVVATSRYVSLGSLAAAFVLPFAAYFTMPDAQRWWMVGLTAVMGVLVIVLHRGNIRRLLAGAEAKIGQRVTVEQPAETVEAQ